MSNLTHLMFTKKVKGTIQIGDTIIKTVTVMPLGLDMTTEEPRVLGIDPGKYFGMSIIGRGSGVILSGELSEEQFPLRDCAFKVAKHIIDLFMPDTVVIEGASYNERYGQVKLAEIRCGFSLGASELGLPVSIVAPKKPRKIVFGNGDIEAMNVWPSLNHNAADSLCLALLPHYDGRRPSDSIQGLVAKRHK